MKKLFLILLVASALSALSDPGLIKLREFEIDPSAASVNSVSETQCAPTSAGEYQFIVQPEKNFSAKEREAISEMGLKIVGFLPPTAYIMLGTKEALKNVEKSFKILYSSEYLPVYKTSAFFRNTVSSLEDKDTEISLRLACKENLESVKQYLSDNGANEIVTISQNPPVLEAKVPSGLVGTLAKRSDVLRVGPKPKCQVFNDVAKGTGLMNVAPMQAEGYTGKGVTVAVADTGFDRGQTSGDKTKLHPDFSGKSIQGKIGENNSLYRTDWADYHGHGTHVCGSATAKSGQYLGTAPDASLYVIAIGSDRYGSVVEVTEKDFQDAYDAGARVVNNSWGDSRKEFHGEYTEYTEFLDTVCCDKPDMLVLFAAGNNNESIAYDNNCTISPQCSAKNVLTVGAAETYRPDINYTYGTAFGAKDKPFKDDQVCQPANGVQQGMAMFSSRGPCKDGRFKPEIVAPGTYIISTESGYDTTNEKYPNRQNLYTVMFGTSMATPLTAGAAADTIQFLKEKGVANPSSALVKATLIHGARRMGQGQYDAPYIEIPEDFPNSVNGYGHVDLGQSFDLTNNVVFLEGVVSNQNDLVTYAFKKNQMGRVKVTLVWTDQPGTPGAREELVNDLDLQVFDGLYTHFNANQSMHNEYTNNSEWYDSPNDPAAGEDMEVRVHGYSGMYYPQSFALVVSGMDEGPIPEPSLAFAFLSLCGLLIFRKK